MVRGGGGAPGPGPVVGGDPLGGGAREARDPGKEERPPPAPQQSERHVALLPASSPCASTTPRSPRKKRKATPPQTEGGSGAGPGAALARGVDEGVRDPAQRAAHSPRGCLGPSPSLPREQVCEGAAAQRGGGRGRRQISKRGNPFRPSWKGGKGKGERKGRKKGGRGELGQGLAGWGGDASCRPGSESPPPTGVCKEGWTGPPTPFWWRGRRGKGQGVCLHLPGFGVRWVSGRGGWEGGREGRGGGPQPCRSLRRREGRNLR